jgi:hypothetical protein
MAAAKGSGHIRASDADREQVIDALKDAFVRGRLTKDELTVRAGRALVSRTFADLTAITADIVSQAGPGARPEADEQEGGRVGRMHDPSATHRVGRVPHL